MKLIFLTLGLLAISCSSEDSQSEKISPPEQEEEQNVDEELGFSIGAVPPSYNTWDEIDQVDAEENSVIILDGNDPIADSCSIYLMGTTENSEGQRQYVVRSSFSHNGDGHKLFVVPAPSADTVKSFGKNVKDPGQISLTFSGSSDFKSVTSASIKWWHNDHFDINRCTDLQVRETKPEPEFTLTLPEGLENLEDVHLADAEQYHLKKYLGYDPVKRDFGEEDSCYIYLMAKEETEEGVSYYFRSSFNHGGYTHPAFKITWADNMDGDLLVGTIDSDEDSFFRLATADSPENGTDVTIYWLHTDHYHTDECFELELQE